MAVRVERDKIALNTPSHEGLIYDEHGKPLSQITAAGSTPVPGDLPGRQTSPELAKLASKYLDTAPSNLVRLHLDPAAAEAVAADVRRLAASVLSQVNG